jgi:hypothetical protein
MCDMRCEIKHFSRIQCPTSQISHLRSSFPFVSAFDPPATPDRKRWRAGIRISDLFSRVSPWLLISEF